jgi:hypothetical protein
MIGVGWARAVIQVDVVGANDSITVPASTATGAHVSHAQLCRWFIVRPLLFLKFCIFGIRQFSSHYWRTPKRFDFGASLVTFSAHPK